MHDWYKLLNDLDKDGPLDPEQTDTVKERIKRESERRQKKWMVSTTVNCLLGLFMMWLGGLAIRDMDNMPLAFLGIVGMIVGFEVTVLAKLFNVSLFSLNKILETVREVQLTVVEQARAANGHDGEGVES